MSHWKSEENELEEIEINCRKSDKWIGDVEKQIEFEEDGKIWILSQTAKKTCEGVASSNAISIPSVFSGEQIKPLHRWIICECGLDSGIMSILIKSLNFS